MTCQELVELVTEYLEGAMEADSCARFEAHLARCRGCRAHLRQVRQTIRVAGRLTEDDLTPEIQRRLLDAFRTWRSGAAG
jgi:predicted anti-sigma-YlaC factor YlaD